ncbi:hypothetical protein RWH43_16820 [Microbacterium sp. KSW2-21]|uniref:Helix-turn-helix domain-containing protein n=1 Tax=Microbacterium algihabitans TaxID=3075992 RepID=A0ABU3S011_9MICO|nr:hypothetical protein [Microbacterium sp. KSW2-21]MDU0328424.1 hypothetical protein [Microbacterium sp. KSW2-21]
MREKTPSQRAYGLGMDHAEHDNLGKLHHRLRSGREIAAVLGLADPSGEQTVNLRDAYNHGWSIWA